MVCPGSDSRQRHHPGSETAADRGDAWPRSRQIASAAVAGQERARIGTLWAQRTLGSET